jgi:Cd2+/Zn2+-exporting ATPase
MKKRGIKIIISLILFIIVEINSVIGKEYIILANPIRLSISDIILLISYLIVGFDIIKKAFRNIFRGKIFDENFLMTVATIGAFGIGEYPEAVAVMLFYQIGELFQSYAVDKSRKSISGLMDIRPDYANVVRDNEIKKVNPDEVKLNEIIEIRPGEKVPLDGIVVEGNSMIDTMALTGESVPRSISVNDEILSGSINKSGLLKVKVTKEFEESTVSKILELVENATNKKSKSENFITKFAKYYTPIVVIVAVLLAIIPPIFLRGNVFTEWIYRALSFLVVSCPCALVISIPLSFFGGIGGASKKGILIKGSNYLEALSNTEIVVCDKTGTLTKGIFEVQKINSVNISEQELIKIAAHGEFFSNHPIAKSIKNAYKDQIDESIIKNVEEISGNGISVEINNKKILIGNDKLMNSNNINFIKCDEIGTIVYVAMENEFIGSIIISDEIKSDSKKTIEELKKHGIRKTVMLTGDRKAVGEDVAEKLGLDEVYTELLPDGKVEKVEDLLKEKTENGKLAFVGDGINDAPVLALADIGIAMGALGSDAAIEAADIVIMTDEPSKIVNAIKLSKKTMRIVKENIIFAIFVKILVLILTAMGITTMWAAVFADVGVSIIAILNALRVLK